MQQADIGICDISVTDIRAQDIHFLYPHIIDHVTFISPWPIIIHNVNLYEPFDKLIWILIIISILSLIFITNLMNKLSKNIKILKFILIAILFKQSINKKFAKHTTNKLIISSWLLICIVLTTSYGGCIHSLRTVPHEYRVETIDELGNALSNGFIQVLMKPTSSYYNLFSVNKIQFIYIFIYYIF